MIKQRRDAAERLATRLFATEKAVDEAIRRMADLTGYMPTARTDAKLSAVFGQEAISQARRLPRLVVSLWRAAGTARKCFNNRPDTEVHS